MESKFFIMIRDFMVLPVDYNGKIHGKPLVPKGHTVDEWNPAPVEVGSFSTIIYKVFYASQVVVWDFFHQHYI